MFSESAVLRGLGRRGPWLFDAVIAVATTGLAWVVGSQYFPDPWGPDLLAYALTAAVFLPLAARRAAPVAVMAASTGALAAYLAAGYDQLALNFWGPLLALYTVASMRPPRVTGACLVAVAPVLFWSGTVSGLSLPIALAETLLLPATAWAFGETGRKLADRNERLAAVTEQLRAEQRKRTEQAIVTERLRIARELHDVVAHHMSVIAMQTGLASYVLDADPDTARTALNVVSGTSREALDEMRHMLDLLRASDDPGADVDGDSQQPAPGLDGLDDLISRVRAAGVEVESTVVGTPRPLPSGLQLTVYRVIQEALTNVLKHGGQCRAWVSVTWHPRQVVVRIDDDGTQAGDPAPGGHGVIGMRERARLYGGTLTAGSAPEGGFAVRLTLPTPEPLST
ncbi:sensor histidine kinase [Actinokineospora iranica]|uniref:sensor histidine kinase n=1 Tax=Actinokineospora iranica TaxID=1271860 RepID=UPI001E39BEC4|nr:sensor histidine kinase [Actinokineospora iranica]